MKVLLVQSYLNSNDPLVFPLGLASLAAVLSDQQVELIDLNTEKEPYKALKDRLASLAPDVVGISLRNIDSTNKREVTFYYEELGPTVELIKANSTAKVVIGGSGFSMFAKEIMSANPKIDYGVYLEGETVFASLLAGLDTPARVPSVYYRENGELKFSGKALANDLNSLALPDRRIISQTPYLENNKDGLGIETKRGCALNCIYCIYGFLNGKTYRLRAPERVVDDIEEMVVDAGADRFTFVDSIFNVPKEHAEAICRELIERRIAVKWSAWFLEKDFSADFLELIKKAGCDRVIFSPDGFNDQSLKILGKVITKDDILRTFEILRASDGFEVSYNFFKNPPGQSFANFAQMMRFCFRAKKVLGRRVHFEFSSLRVEPHTKLYDVALTEKVIKDGDNLLYPVYYSQKKTIFIDLLFNLMLRFKGK